MRLQRKRTKVLKVPNDSDAATVSIRKLSLHELDVIEEKASNLNLADNDASSMGLQPVKRDTLIAKACVVGFTNFFDDNGKPIKFSKNRIGMLANFEVEKKDATVRFFEWISDEHDKFFKEVEEEEESSVKN